nr:hypothetical protein [Myxococcus xanthus]
MVARDEAADLRRFGVTTGELGVCYTRTGRRFFSETGLECAAYASVSWVSSPWRVSRWTLGFDVGSGAGATVAHWRGVDELL